jgi:RES domain-containing protein
MEMFRISRFPYASRLTSSGAANRWNAEGEEVIYAGSSRSLSTLEQIVHFGSVVPRNDYRVMIISVADDDHLFEQISIKRLPVNWRTLEAYPSLQKIGSAWYRNQESLVLKVPSVIIPQEYNYVINTKHPEFRRKVKLVRTEDYFWDPRLLRSL